MYLQRTNVAHAADYAGTYTAPNGSQITFKASGSHLALLTQQGPKLLYPRNGTTFYVDDARFSILG